MEPWRGWTESLCGQSRRSFLLWLSWSSLAICGRSPSAPMSVGVWYPQAPSASVPFLRPLVSSCGRGLDPTDTSWSWRFQCDPSLSQDEAYDSWESLYRGRTLIPSSGNCYNRLHSLDRSAISSLAHQGSKAHRVAAFQLRVIRVIPGKSWPQIWSLLRADTVCIWLQNAGSLFLLEVSLHDTSPVALCKPTLGRNRSCYRYRKPTTDLHGWKTKSGDESQPLMNRLEDHWWLELWGLMMGPLWFLFEWSSLH